MRILVISDSHGKHRTIEKIIERHPEVRHIFFLGDNTKDIENSLSVYRDKIFHIVSGNCDYNSFYPVTDIAEADGIKVLFSHGHPFGVKHGYDGLLSAAKMRNSKIALYGHTHVPHISYEDGVYLVNPGSCSCSREGADTYAVIDIEENGIMPIIMKVNP